MNYQNREIKTICEAFKLFEKEGGEYNDFRVALCF